MDLLSISQLAQFSGKKPHTIRTWEQRYNALKPNRTEGNTRYYNGDQLRRLLNLVSLMESDYKISDLASMSDEKLFRLLEKVQENNTPGPTNYFISQLIAAGMEYDEPAFEKIFSHCLLRYGLKKTYVEIIYPMLDRVGLMWAINVLPPANEHFISNLVRQKLYTFIDSLPPRTRDSFSWVLFLPENEFHEIGLLAANYLLRLSGEKTIYLGENVPVSSVLDAAGDTKAENLLLFLTHYDDPENSWAYLKNLMRNFNGKRIYVAGNPKLLSQLGNDKILTKLQSVEDLETHLKYRKEKQ